MDLRKRLQRHPKFSRGNAAQLAAQLAPLEEVDSRSAATQSGRQPGAVGPPVDSHYGAIIVDNESLHVPKDMMEGSDEKTYLGMEPVVIVILAFMLVFIAFIAWQISLMPVE